MDIQANPAAMTTAAGGTPRLSSLDVLRGLTVIGMIVVNSAAALEQHMATFPQLLHSHWAGFTLADSVFPAFLFMVGVSIPMALRNAAPGHFRRIVRRSLLLVLIGFLLHNLGTLSDFSRPLRLFGVLQRTGIVYGVCALLFLTTGARTRLTIAAVLLLAYWGLLLVPPFDGVPRDLWLPGHDLAGAVDRLLLGDHLYVKGPTGFDPEGPLGDLPSIAHGLIGVAVGEYLLRHPGRRAAIRIAGGGVAMMLAGIAWGQILPVVKSLWTPSFVLLSCGLTTILLAALHLLLDGREAAGRNPLVLFCVAFGGNAITAYALHVLASGILRADLFTVPYRLLAPAIGGEWAELVPIALFLGLMWLPLDHMRRHRWTVKI